MKFLRLHLPALTDARVQRRIGTTVIALLAALGLKLVSHQPPRSAGIQPARVIAMDLSADGEFLALALGDGTLEMRRGSDNALLYRQHRADAPVRALEVFPPGSEPQRLAISTAAGRFSILDAKTGRVVTPAVAFPVSAQEVRFDISADGTVWAAGENGDGGWIARLVPDQTRPVVVLSQDNASQSFNVAPEAGPVFGHGASRLLGARLDRILFETPFGGLTEYSNPDSTPSLRRVLDATDASALSVAIDQVVVALNGRWQSLPGDEPSLETYQPDLILDANKASVTSAAFSPDGTRIVTASDDNTARVWTEGDSGVWTSIPLEGHEAVVNSAAFSQDGTRIVTASDDNTARVWTEGDSGVWTTTPLEGHEDSVLSAAFSTDGTRIVTASFDMTARVWTEGDSGVWTSIPLEGHEDWVWSAAFSPDGTRIVTASGDTTARVWTEDDTGAWTSTPLEAHDNYVFSAAFSPDGTRIVTASADNTARVWTEGGSGVWTSIPLEGHEAWAWSAAFSPDGTRIVTASADKTARVWTEDGSGVWTSTALEGHEASVTYAAFSPDGTRIVTASADKTARVWAESTAGWRPAKSRTLPCGQDPLDMQISESHINGYNLGDQIIQLLWTASGEDGICGIPLNESGPTIRIHPDTPYSAVHFLDSGYRYKGADYLRIEASRFQDAIYSEPILGKPDDLVQYGGRALRQLPSGDTESYPGRAAIRQAASQVIAYARPFDVFRLQIEGFGTLEMPDGSRIELRYAANNGHPFRSVANYLTNEGEISAGSLDEIEAWMNQAPQADIDMALNQNPRYIFFSEEDMGRPRPPTRPMALVGDANGTVSLLDLTKPNKPPIATFGGHRAAITHIDSARMEGRHRAAVASADGHVQILDIPFNGTPALAGILTATQRTLTAANEARIGLLDTIAPKRTAPASQPGPFRSMVLEETVAFSSIITDGPGDAGLSDLARPMFAILSVIAKPKDVRAANSATLDELSKLALSAEIQQTFDGRQVIQIDSPLSFLMAFDGRPCPDDFDAMSAGADPATVTMCIIKELRASGEFEYVEPDFILTPQFARRPPEAMTPEKKNEPLFPLQWALQPSSNGGAGFEDLWPEDGVYPGPRQVVAIVDTGILYTHPEVLSMNLLPGWDFISDPRMSNDGDGRDPDANDAGDLCDSSVPGAQDSFHGTAMASVISSTANMHGMASAAPYAFILPVRAVGKCGGRLSDINDALRWAAGLIPVESDDGNEVWNDNPADIILLPIGAFEYCPASLQDTIDIITERGATVIVPAGNSGIATTYFAPAGCRNVVTVAASDARGHVAPYSNYGPEVTYLAPGGDMSRDDNGDGYPDGIMTAALTHKNCFNPVTGAVVEACNYSMEQGTSLAAAHVAAAFALLRARYPDADIRPLIDTRHSVPTPVANTEAKCTDYPGAEPVQGRDNICLRPVGRMLKLQK